jgi:C_GCAxxG_C_C family probable redox protein
MNRIDSAVSCFREGFCCTQALLSSYGTQYGLNRETALRVSAAFGGGMSPMGETCGAATGALMVIGLRHGNTIAKDKWPKERTYGRAREFVDRFQSRNGSIVCRQMLGCDISTPEGMNLAEEKELFASICPKFVRDSAEIIEQILE